MEDLPDHARRHYRLGQPGTRPLAWTRLGHGLYRAHDTGRRTPPRCPLPRLARSMAEEARTTRLQDLASFCLGQDRGDPAVCALRRSGRLRRLPLTVQRLVVLTEGLVWSPLAVRRLDRSEPLPPRLAVQDRHGIPIELQGVFVAVADADGADLTVLRERPDEVENHPLLGGAVEVEAVFNSYIHQIVGGQALVYGALEVIRSVVVAGLSRRRAVQSVIRVVGTIRKETQDQVRMRGAALAEVDLDSRVLPAIAAPDGDKVDGEPSQGTAFP